MAKVDNRKAKKNIKDQRQGSTLTTSVYCSMKKGKSVDRTPEYAESTNDSILLKCLDDLLNKETTDTYGHLVPNIVTCLEWLLSEDENAYTEGIKRLHDFFVSSSIYIQNIIITEIRRRSSFTLCASFCARFTSTQDGAYPPKHLIMSYIPEEFFDVKLHESLTFCMGKNSSFNLGVVSDDEVKESRFVGVTGVCETSMSDDHSLFLTKTGSVYGCGNSRFGKLGPVNEKYIVEPVLIQVSEAPVLGIFAANDYSVFVTKTTVYISGVLNDTLPVLKRSKSKFYEIPLERDQCTFNFTVKAIQQCSDRDGFILIDIIEHNKLQRYTFGNYKGALHNLFSATNEFYARTSQTDLPAFAVGDDGDDANFENIGSMEPFETCHSCTITTNDPSIKDIQAEVIIGDVMDFSANEAGVVLRKSLKAKFTLVPGHRYEHCRICLNGQFVNLNVLQLHVSPNGSLIMLATLTDFVNTPCLYRGQLHLMSSNMTGSSGEESFHFPTQYHKNEMYHNKHLIAVIQEIPCTHSVRHFSATNDGLSIIYTVDDSYAIDCDSQNARAFTPEKWKSLDLNHLQQMREQYGLLGNIADNVVQCSYFEETTEDMAEQLNESLSIPCQLIKLWCPALMKSEVNAITFEKERNCLWRFLQGYRFISNNAISHRFVDSEEDVTLNVFHRSGHFAELLKSDVDSIDNSLLDCILVSNDGVEILFNNWWLSLQSMYFEVAVNYQKNTGFPCFEIDYSGSVVKDAVRVLTHPSYLFLLSVSQVCLLIDFFDHYLMELLVQDCIDVLFFQIGESTLVYLFDLYNNFAHWREYITENFTHNLHLLTMWKSSSEAPLSLLIDVQKHVDKLVENGKNGHWSPTTKHDVVSFSANNPSANYSADTVSVTLISDSKRQNSVMGLMSTNIWPLFSEASVIDLLIRGKYCCNWESNKIENELKSLSSNNVTYAYLPAMEAASKNWLTHMVDDLRKKHTTDARVKTNKTRKISFRKISEKSTELDNIPTGESISVCEETENVTDNSFNPDPSPIIEVTQSHPKENLLSNALPTPSAWKSTKPVEIADIDSSSRTKHGASRRFNTKISKFHAVHVEEDAPHVAPWASFTSKQGESLKQIQAKEQNCLSKMPIVTPKREIKRKERNNSWSQAGSQSSPSTPSFAEIMADQELKSKPKQSIGRPLEYVVCEESAMQQLVDLYRQQAGDEVIVSIERIDASWQE